MKILAEIKKIVKQNKQIIYLGILIFLVALLSFSIGWIIARRESKIPLQFEYENVENS
jgi:hypothetical protein